ncbi:NUDIX hydrolase [Corynebacterium sp. H130]|uniref:NUDIX hydrolase n=1 Tax=Corynebacterium sp. H130 TaxID=3133444 RepID=UPI0030A7BA5C
MYGDGDGWSAGPDGTRRWGKYGAAGLFLYAERTHTVLMQHRAYWTASGGMWGIPGGARDSHESAVDAALREAHEETGVSVVPVQVIGSAVTAGPYPADPDRPELSGNWTYTTVVAKAPVELEVESDEESLELRWVPVDQLEELDLLPAFIDALPIIREILGINK